MSGKDAPSRIPKAVYPALLPKDSSQPSLSTISSFAPSSSYGGGNKSFSEILPGAASLSLGASASFNLIHDGTTAGPSEETEKAPFEIIEAPAGPAEQEVDSLAVFTRNKARQRAQELLQLLRDLRAAQDEAKGDVIVFHDCPGLTYEIFLELIAEDEDLDRRLQALRYDYSHKREQFFIRMPSKIHDGMAEFLGRKIASWLENLMEADGALTPNQRRASIVARGILDFGTANISILSDINSEDAKDDVRQADKSYEYQVEDSDETLPDLVIEVIWSHPRTRQQLVQRAEEYIINSEGNIRTVIVIDLLDFYPDPSKNGLRNKCGKFSILRAKVDRRGRASVDEANSVRGKNFITGVDEGHVPGANIELSLLDFVSECRTSSLPDFEDAPIEASHLRDTSIVITSEQLYERFEAARKAWFKEQAKKKLIEKPFEADTSAAKVSTSKKSKGKEAKTGKKRKLNR